MRPTVALINDTSLFENHFGCTLVAQAFREQFSRVGVELKYAFPREFSLDKIGSYLDEVDLVVVNGEGSIHHGRRMHLVSVADHYPAVLVNAVYQSNPHSESLGRFLYRATRESLSAAEIQKAGFQCDCVPDLCFASSQLRSFVRPPASLDLGITDSVLKKRVSLGGISLHKKAYGFSPRVSVAEYLTTLSQYRRLCIGRFHAVVAASVLGIPFSCWESNSWKISGMLQDMDASDHFFGSYDEARLHAPEHMDPKIKRFSEQSVPRIEAMFDKIADIARAQMRQHAQHLDCSGSI